MTPPALVVWAVAVLASTLVVATPARAAVTVPTITDVPCDTGAASADGRVTNPGPDPVDVVVAGPDRVIVGGRLDQGAAPLAVVLQPGVQVVTFVGVTAGDVITLAVDGVVVAETTVGDCRAAVRLGVGVDADLDGVFGRAEAGPVPAGPVVLELMVTNLGVPAAVELVVSTGGQSRVVFGASSTGGSARCTLLGADGAERGPVAPGDLLTTGGTARCTLTMPTATPAIGRVVTHEVTAVVLPPDAASASATDAVTVSTTTDVAAALVVDVTTDADGDGVATDVEFAPGPGVDVPVRIQLENVGPSAGTLRVSARLPDGTVIDVLGDDAAATCLDPDGALVGPGEVVAAGATVVCELTLPSFSPTVVAPNELTVLAELLTTNDDLQEQLVLATATDDTAVSSVLVLDETVEGDGPPDGGDEDDRPAQPTSDDETADAARLAEGGVESVVLVVGGALLLLLGALALRSSRSAGGSSRDEAGGPPPTGDDQ